MLFKEGDLVRRITCPNVGGYNREPWTLPEGATGTVVEHSDDNWLTLKDIKGGKGPVPGGGHGAEYFELVPKPPRYYVADHARRSLRKLGLTKQEAAAFVRNVRDCARVPWKSEFTLSCLSRKATHVNLCEGFTWAHSPEGFQYWETIERRINEQVRGK